ncbi:coiled-coil domain-containing protein 27 [Amblyraja radiata]|uniref:coiled-coil domain-containing protein 27 n=1 Tax=Amblyraja radiata TaxID=386614 RepID=UPI001402411E|nr:coiled-coil domain-containing protein 27 [Amblyraja radiata]
MKGFLELQKREHPPEKTTVKKCDVLQIKAIRKGTKKLEDPISVRKGKRMMLNPPTKGGMPAVMLSAATDLTILSRVGYSAIPNSIQTDWSNENFQGISKENLPLHISMMHEKEKCAFLLEEQSEHIADIEAESARKDLQIETLQNEIEHLSIQLNQSAIADIYNSQVHSMHEHMHRQSELDVLNEIKGESKQKDLIIADLRDQIWQLGLQIRLLRDDVSIAILDVVKDEDSGRQQEFEAVVEPATPPEGNASEENIQDEERASSVGEDVVDYTESQVHISSEPTKSPSSEKWADEELLSLPTDDGKVEMLQIRNEELEKAVTELEENYNMSTGTVIMLNRKMSLAEDKLKNTEATVARLQKELRERCSQLQDMSSKFSSLREANNQLRVVTDLQNENVRLRELVVKLEAGSTEQTEAVVKLREQTGNLQLRSTVEEARTRQLQDEYNTVKTENRNLQRNLQEHQVTLQATNTRLERFISRIVQVIYSAPGVEQPNREITDDDTLKAFKTLLDERLEFYGLLIAHEIAVRPLFSSTDESHMTL